jgi:hypothetical protein
MMANLQIPDIVALVVILIVLVSFWKMHVTKGNDFNVFDLIMEGGRISRIGTTFLAAFFVCSWVIVRLTLDGKMTDAYLLWYGGVFVAPILVKFFGLPKETSSKPEEPK